MTTSQRKSKLSPLQRQQTAPSAFLPFAPHGKATTPASAAPSPTPPEASPRPHNPLSSTIYHRHEARRAKTLENANDERPALVRILAQLSSSTTSERHPSQQPQEHQHHPEAALVLSHPQQQQQPQFADANVFSNETTPTTATATAFPHVTCTAAALTAGFSSAVGARLADWVFLHNSSHSRASKALATSSSVWSLPTTAASFKVRYNGEGSLSLVHPEQQQQQHAHKQSWSRQLLQNRATNLSSTPSTARWSSPSLTPVVLLFGVQAWTEQYLLRGAQTALEAPHLKDEVHPNQALSVASVAASGVAGAALGVYQQLRTGRSCSVGTQAGAAVLYFGTYRLIKGAFSTGSRSHQGTSYNSSNASSSDPVLSTAVAGAVAGMVYETTRLLGSNGNRLFLASPPLSGSPFATTTSAAPSLRLVLTRSAPAHTILFLGYEATQSLLVGSGQ